MPLIAFIMPVLIAAVSSTGASDGHFEYRSYSFHGATAHFGVWLPPGYKSRRDWPAILYLHGADESGTDGRAPMRTGLGQALTSHPAAWPFVVVVPQKPSDQEEWWEEEDLTLDVLRHAVHEFHFDARKLALVGVSQGGHGAWMLAARHPTMWSCVVPIASYGRPRTIAPRMARLPVWAFHGAKDDVVNPAEAKNIVAAIEAEHKRLDLEIDAKLTVFPSAGHDSWDQAFADPALPRWILAQSKRP